MNRTPMNYVQDYKTWLAFITANQQHTRPCLAAASVKRSALTLTNTNHFLRCWSEPVGPVCDACLELVVALLLVTTDQYCGLSLLQHCQWQKVKGKRNDVLPMWRPCTPTMPMSADPETSTYALWHRERVQANASRG